MDKVLINLAIAAQKLATGCEEKNLLLTQLVDKILRSRAICRPFGNQFLCGVRAEIYEQVREKLLQDVEEELDKYQPERLSIDEWANNLRNRTFRQILEDYLLKNLALEIQQTPYKSEFRQHLLGELIAAIRLSGKLCRPHQRKFSPNFYELIYEEAVSETLLYICRNIDKYDPQRGKEQKFITWVNFHLDKLVIECRRKFDRVNTYYFPSLSEIEDKKITEKSTFLGDIVREYIEEDAENLFKETQVTHRPDANFQAIALARLSGQSWEEISSTLGIAIPTLSSFYQRCCRKFAQKFKTDLQS
jgi:DNA-directed RNA polymerase specialized sigma24 family protein